MQFYSFSLSYLQVSAVNWEYQMLFCFSVIVMFIDRFIHRCFYREHTYAISHFFFTGHFPQFSFSVSLNGVIYVGQRDFPNAKCKSRQPVEINVHGAAACQCAYICHNLFRIAVPSVISLKPFAEQTVEQFFHWNWCSIEGKSWQT